MFMTNLRKVVSAYGHERWREASCNLVLDVLHKDARKPYQPTDHKPTSDELVNLCHEFSVSLTSCMRESELVLSTVRAWKAYLREYRVAPLESDLYKLAYWYGEALISLLKSRGQHTTVIYAAKIHRLNVMDSFLFQHVGVELTRDIFTKLCITGCRNAEAENLGKYGTYLIFKSTSLQLDPSSA